MIQAAKFALIESKQYLDDASQGDLLIELDESVLDQVGGGDAPVPKNRAWTV